MKSEDYPKLVIIGIIAAILEELFTWTMKSFHWLNISAFEASSMMFMRKPDWWLGVLALPMVTILAVITHHYLTIRVIGTESLLLKGTIYAMTVYALIFQFWGNALGNTSMILDTTGNYVFAVSTAFTGFIAAYLTNKYVIKGG